MEDDNTGFNKAPARYMAHGRETCDRMRDEAHRAAVKLNVDFELLRDRDEIVEMADVLFAYACDTHALKYEDRLGLKGDPTRDAKKAAFWRQMAAHVRLPKVVLDPRASRSDFVPYVRPT